jgi:hypothetical protein
MEEAYGFALFHLFARSLVHARRRFDIEGVELSHFGERCSFHTMLQIFGPGTTITACWNAAS